MEFANLDDVVYVNKKTPVKIRCKEHDYWFEVLPDTHVRRNSGCPICSDSVGEVEVRLWLDKHHVLYEVQHVIPNENPTCKRSHLRVDFWLPIHNIIIAPNESSVIKSITANTISISTNLSFKPSIIK